MDRGTSEDEMDADDDLDGGGSRFGAFLLGVLLGAVVSAAAAVAVSLTSPPPADLPPAGPVLPSAGAPAETSPAEDRSPTPEPAGAEPAAVAPDPATAPAPAESTEPAAVPETSPDAGPETAPDAPPGASALPGPAGSALAANARMFDAPRQAALLAVVLTGDEVADLSADRLAQLTMPLTVAIPPETPRAAELGADARAAGHEVLADLSLAAEASVSGPGQAQAAVQRIASLDMAVGATATGGTTDVDLLAPILAELGRHGFAWVDTGAAISTPAERIAREIGMPYTQGNKTIGGGSSPDQIHRAIGSAAHQARQWGTSVLFLDASEQSLQALVRWALEQRSDNAVRFAPISAVIERRAAR